MNEIAELSNMMKKLRLVESSKIVNDLIIQAKQDNISYYQFIMNVFSYEDKARQQKALERRLKQATLPYYRTLEDYDISLQPNLNDRQFNELRDITWIEKHYNLILLGPTGVGKTFLSVGLAIEVIRAGYDAIFITMGELIHVLKTRDISKKSQIRLKRICDTQLMIIDDMMFLAMDKKEANLFFHFINDIYESTSIIITSNKAPNEWIEVFGDEIITGAILDRIISKAEIIQLSGDSYRLTHRESIFKN
ncbi:IS21-like element helper ATPase IstB [Periweissella ghanensis]|uniref:IS21 family transposase IS643 n=1 Tax=Periweissella ghanensis TaxID=467997 RepID=A0ABN8BRE7_9LACO|nr:IS21-like element helper ATPase IstB [Periweissella ghanensis]MCM0601468.1 IS21-like element helper ATPase IstB [Periweissella ghanensis]CAH0419515.1 IS21 family transposase IS643 [Periweissella ghanensis]